MKTLQAFPRTPDIQAQIDRFEDGMADAICRAMAGVRNHEELYVYQLSEQVEDRVRELLQRYSFSRDFLLIDQLRRASRSPCPNIAEGFSRYYPRDNAKFVRVAKSSLTEVIKHLRTALVHEYIPKTEHDEICVLAKRARKAATNYARYLETAKAPGINPPKPRGRRGKRKLGLADRSFPPGPDADM